MRIFIGFDDTDTADSDRGTGKLARWFERSLPEECRVWGVVRQQLLVHEHIPFTSHNSSACVVIDTPEPSVVEEVIERAAAHIKAHFLEGSDPGLCVASEKDSGLPKLTEFGFVCTSEVVGQKDALQAASGVHLSGHGGTDDGIIGAAAAVGLTLSGWCGRFVEFGGLRELPENIRVSDLEARGIQVLSVDRDARVPARNDMVMGKNWIRPRLMGGRPVLMVKPGEKGCWENIGEKRKKWNREIHA